jgi:preprotein translocase subunit SecD
MKVLNRVQLVAILVFVALGSFVLLSPYLIKKAGAVVVAVSNSNCQNVHVGDIITEAGGNQIQTLQDFNSIRFQPKQFVSLVVNSGPGGCIALSDGTLGISVKETLSSQIIFGVDLVGGKKYTLNAIPADQMQNISDILSARISYFGVSGVKIENENGTLDITTPENANINQLLFHGKFEGSVEEQINLDNNAGVVFVGDVNYTITRNGNSFSIGDNVYSINDSFYLKDVKTTIENTTNTSIILSLLVYNNSDILGEAPGYSQMGFDQNTRLYSFSTVISLKAAAAKKFNEITKNIKTVISGSQINLDAALVDKLDGNELSRLGIPVTLKGQDLNNVAIIIFDASKDSLTNKKVLVEASINSGYVPYNLSIVRSESIQPTQENNVVPSIAAIGLLLAVAPFGFGIKYKKLKHNSISVLIGTAEIFSIFSLFASLQVFYRLNIVFDFSALIGLMLIAINWMINVISLNLSRHAQKELVIRIRFRKIVSMTGLSKILLLVATIFFAIFGYQSASIIVFGGIVLDWLLFRPFYKSFIS